MKLNGGANELGVPLDQVLQAPLLEELGLGLILLQIVDDFVAALDLTVDRLGILLRSEHTWDCGLVSVVSLGVVDDSGRVVVLFASHAGQDPQNSMESALGFPLLCTRIAPRFELDALCHDKQRCNSAEHFGFGVRTQRCF